MGTNGNDERAKVFEIADRAKHDPEYMRELGSNPVATLEREGLSAPAIATFLREEGLEDEVSGYLASYGNEALAAGCTCTGCCITRIGVQ